MKTAFIGLGIMGSRMAANLQKKGHPLVVYNRTRQKADALLGAGASWAGSPREAAQDVGILVTMLSTPKAVSDTALGENGFLDHLPSNSLWMDCSTVNPSFSRSMAEESSKRGIRFLDAPVAGSKIPAEQGQLLFFVGGNKADLDEAKPLLAAMGKAVYHLGENGMGTAMKMVNNLMLSSAMVAFSEALVLGDSLGIPQKQLFDTLLASPVTAPFLALKRTKLETGNFDPEFPLRWMHKDTQLVSETAYETGVVLPAGNIVKEIFGLAVRKGMGDLDLSAVFRVLSEKQ